MHIEIGDVAAEMEIRARNSKDADFRSDALPVAAGRVESDIDQRATEQGGHSAAAGQKFRLTHARYRRVGRDAQPDRLARQGCVQSELAIPGVVADHLTLAFAVRNVGKNMNAQSEDSISIQGGLDGSMIVRFEGKHGDPLPVAIDLGPLVEEDLHRVVAAEDLERDLVAYRIDRANFAANHGALPGRDGRQVFRFGRNRWRRN